MDTQDIRKILEQLVEPLAAIEHERWAHWQRYVHDKAITHTDGSLTIPADIVRRWNLQIETPYEALPEDQKISDREQVNRYLPTIIAALDKLATK